MAAAIDLAFFKSPKDEDAGEGGEKRWKKGAVTNLINWFNKKVIEEIPLLVSNSLWRYRERQTSGPSCQT